MMWILVPLGVFLASYIFLIKPLKYWSSLGVPQGCPVPFLGDNWRHVFRMLSFAGLIEHVYQIYPNMPYCGIHHFMRPTLVIRDPEMIKMVGVKDFEHFIDRRGLESNDPLWRNNLTSLTGQKWKEMRTILSPSFTSSKMRSMFVLMDESCRQFVQHFLKKNESVITVEMKDSFSRFANDVIASTAFGVNVDSLENKDNEFYIMGKTATDFTETKQLLRVFGFFLAPGLMNFFKINLFPEKVRTFFTNLVRENIEIRQRNKIVRPDMLNLLLEACKDGIKHDEVKEIHDAGFATVKEVDLGVKRNIKKIDFTEEDITAQTFIFFFAGFEQVSSLMCFTSYELALNPDVQHQLIREIDEVRVENGEKLPYDALLKMKYMDMVVSESLRKWPTALLTDRVCVKDYILETDEPAQEPLKIEKNVGIWFPIYGIHRDPKYYPEPERFDPERFNDENKSKINPYTYIPFGVGPRNCIGSRFALLETKALLFHLLTYFEIVPIEGTCIPLKLNRKSINMTAEGGFWLGLKRRN